MTDITLRDKILDKIYSISLARTRQGKCELCGDKPGFEMYGRFVDAWLKELGNLFEQQRKENL